VLCVLLLCNRLRFVVATGPAPGADHTSRGGRSTEWFSTVNEVSSEVLELAHLYERAPIGLCVTDTDHRFVRINQRLCDIHGKLVEEHIGRTIHEVIPHISGQIVPMLRNVIDSSEPVLGHEVRGHTSAYPDEERVYLTDHYPLRSKTGSVVYVHSMVQDVTPAGVEASESTSGAVDPVRPRSNTLADLFVGGGFGSGGARGSHPGPAPDDSTGALWSDQGRGREGSAGSGRAQETPCRHDRGLGTGDDGPHPPETEALGRPLRKGGRHQSFLGRTR
jgi:PAS domain S-box-containing protein